MKNGCVSLVSLLLSPVTTLGSPFCPSFKASFEAKCFSQFLWAPGGEAGCHRPTSPPCPPLQLATQSQNTFKPQTKSPEALP